MEDTVIKALLVEDNPGDARLLREMLAEAPSTHCELLRAERLGEALACLGEQRFDVVLLDLSLPDSHGLDTVLRVREEVAGVPIVVLTGLSDEALGLSALRAGAQDYLVKGQLDSNLLGRTMRYAVERSRAETAAAALAQVGRDLTRSLDPAEVAQRIVDSVRGLFGARMSALFRLDPKCGDLVVLAVSGNVGPSYAPNLRFPQGIGVLGVVVQERRPVVSGDLLGDSRVTLTAEESENRVGLAVPLVVQQQVTGALGIGERVGRVFTQEEIRLAQAFADQAAVAFENARLFADSEARRWAAEALLNITQALSSTVDLKQVLKIIARRTAQAVGAERCSIILRRVGQAVPVMSQFADGHEDPGLWARFKASGPHRMGDVPAYAKAMETRRPVMIEDTISSSLSPAYWLEEFGTRAALVIPLVHQDEAIGVLNLDQTNEAHTWRQDQIDLAMTIANQAALAVENARLFEETVGRQRAAETLADVGRRISQLLDPGEVGRLIAESVRSLLAVQCSVLYRLEPKSGNLVRLAISGELGPTFAENAILPQGTGLAGLAVSERRPMVTPNLLTDARITFMPETRTRIEQAPFRAALTVPLVVQGAVIGAFGVADQLGRVFTDDEIRLAQAFADQASLALERARLYEEIRAARDFLQSVAENSPDGIVTADIHGRFTSFSPGAEEMFGYRAEEILGQPVADYYQHGLEEARAIAERLRVEGRIRNYETAFRAKDGRWFEVESSISLLRDGSGAIVGTVGVLRDVRARKRAEDELRRQREARVQSEKVAAMGSMLAGVAHELNNPLAIILGHMALFRETVGNGPLAERTEKIARAADRCVRIVKNFLSLARQHPPERRRVALSQVVQEAVELLAYPLRVDDVEVTLNLASELPVLWADPHQLHQMLVNLISNAHHAMRQTSTPRRLIITTRHDPVQGRASLEIVDTGPGIPAEIQSQIFDPFFTTKPLGEGSGLGLSLCQGIVESHGGSIGAESQPGQGTAFLVELPVVAPPVGELEGREVEAAPASRGKTILVVDDEREMADLLAEMLCADGHEVETAGDGAMALDRLRERPYDVVLSDIRMPRLDGPGLYRELERCYPGLRERVIFITGDELTPETRHFLEQTDVLRLGKPFERAEVRRVIERVLGP